MRHTDRVTAPAPPSAPNVLETQLGASAVTTKAADSASWWRIDTTPDIVRSLAVFTVLATVVAGVLGWFLADQLTDNTVRLADSTGEVLVVNQQVQASFAEAHAAAVSVHLAGPAGNREQRRIYESAIERAASGLERVAASVGDDPESHAALEQVAALTTRYVSLVESARSSAIAGDASGNAVLAEAGQVTGTQISPQVDLVTRRFQTKLADETGTAGFVVTFVIFVALLVLLGLGQFWLFQRFHRIVNVPLLLASLAVVAWLIYSGSAYFTQRQAFATADDDAYQSIEASGDLLDLAFTHRAAENAAVLGGASSVDSVVMDDASATETRLTLLEQGADSFREQALVQEVRIRWDRYVNQSRAIEAALAAGDVAQAERVTSGTANDAFNAFNATAEALLLDNRQQFFAEVDYAVDLVRWLRWVIIAVTIAVAVLAWWGYSMRLREYQ